VEFSAQVEQHEAGAVVRVVGEVDLASAPRLRETLERCIESGTSRIVVDLSGVEFLDSSGLGALVGALKRMRARGNGTFVLAAPPESVRRMFDVTGVALVFDIRPTLDAALV